MAVDEDDAGRGETHGAGMVFRVVAEVEGLGFRQREDIVEDGISIGKRYRGADGHHQRIGAKLAVLLLQEGGGGLGLKFAFKVDGYARALDGQEIAFGRNAQIYGDASLVAAGGRGDAALGKPALDDDGPLD